MTIRRIFACLAVGLSSTGAATALAATRTSVRPDGLYAGEIAHRANWSVDLFVTKNGHVISVKSSGFACQSGSEAPFNFPTTLLVPLPHSLTIGRGGTFSFSGNVHLTAKETQTDQSMNTQFAIKGAFAKSIKADKPGAVTGTVSDSLCGYAHPVKFSLEYAPGIS